MAEAPAFHCNSYRRRVAPNRWTARVREERRSSPIYRTSNYTASRNAFKRIYAGAPASEEATPFHDTAAHVYRITT
jgi:hypothetical protein